VPICAAEIRSEPRVVEWISLVQAHGNNLGNDIIKRGVNAANVWVCFMVYSGATAFDFAQDFSGQYFKAVDPANAIPDAHTLLIWGKHTDLVITSLAEIAAKIVSTRKLSRSSPL